MDFTWLQTVIYLLPVAALIWKAALLSAEIKDLRGDLTKLEGQFMEEKHATDSAISTLMAMMNDVKIIVTRVETKLEERK